MSYARSKNLTIYDVVTIASMVEDEAQLDSERQLVAAVIYNRLREGMPLGIDATIRFATGNYTEPLTESELAIDSPYNTRTQRRSAAGADRQPRPGLDRSRRPPGQGRLPLLRGRAGQPAASTPSPRPKPSSKPTSPATTRRAKRPAATRRTAAGNRRAAARRPRAPGRPLALAGDAERGAGRAGAGRGVELRGDRRRPGRASRRGCGRCRAKGFVGANVTVPHKGAALALADELSETAREIGAANTLVFDGRARSAPTTPTPRDCCARCRARRRGKRALVLGAGGAARAVVWALLREGAEVEVWNRTELRSRNLCEELGGAPVAEPDQGDYELIVNSTAVGLGGEDPFAELPLDAGRLRRRPDRRRHGLRRRADRAAAAPPKRPARPPSTASRSSSSRAPSRSRSGPAASPRSTRCAPPPGLSRRAARRIA